MNLLEFVEVLCRVIMIITRPSGHCIRHTSNPSTAVRVVAVVVVVVVGDTLSCWEAVGWE